MHIDHFNEWCKSNGIRFATKADEDEIFALLTMSHAEIGLFRPDRDKVRAAIRTATDRRGGMIGVIESDGRIVASIGLSISDAFWYTRDQALFELWTFVHPEHRRSPYAKVMVEFSKKCSDWFKEHGTVLPLISGIFTLKQTEPKCRLYRRQLPPVGQFYLYNLGDA